MKGHFNFFLFRGLFRQCTSIFLYYFENLKTFQKETKDHNIIS